MGTMKVTPELLESPKDSEEINLTLLTGPIGEFISQAMDSEFDSWADHYSATTGHDLPEDWFDQVTWDYDKMYADLARDLPEMLEQAYPDLFTTDRDNNDAPVWIGEVESVEPHDRFGWGRETVMARFHVNQYLWPLAEQYGVTEIMDGQGISGFVRTADDHYWTVLQVMQAIMGEMDDSYTENIVHTLEEFACSDGRVGEFIDYGELNVDIARAEEV